MNDNVNENEKVGGWWAASSDAGHEQVNLYEVVNGRESLLEVMTVTLEDFPTLEDFKIEVKRLFGGGIYVAAVRGERGTFAKRPQFAISGRPIREKAEEAQQSSQVSGLDRLAEVIASGNANVMAVLAKMNEKPEAPDAFELMEKAATILNRNGAAPAPQKSLLEQLQELRTAAELMGMTGKPEGEEGGSWAKDLVGGLLPAFMAGMGGGAGGGDLAGLDDDETPAEQPPAQDAQAVMLAKLKLLLTSMVQMAELEVTTARAIAVIEKKAAAYWPMLKSVIQRPDALTMAAQMVPAVSEHQQWFSAFRDAVMGVTVEGGKGGSTGRKPGSGKKPAASPKPRTAGGRASRDKADASANG